MTEATGGATASTPATQGASNNTNAGADGGNNGRRNRRNNNENNRNVQQSVDTKFKGKVETLASLGMRDEKKVDTFLQFQKEVYEYVLANYKYPSDIAYLVKELKSPMKKLMKDMPSLNKLKETWGLDPNAITYSTDEQAIIDDLKELLGPERKTFVDRKSILTQNMAKLFGLIWGQCTPKLREDIMGNVDYNTKATEYDCLWLMEKTKSASSGADRGQYEYLSYLRALRSMVTCRQQDNESVEAISDRLVSLLQNFKLVGGDIAPMELIEIEKAADTNLTDEQAKEKVEDKILGIMLIESANDKRYGELKRSLQNSMAEGHNRYPEDRARARTLLSKYKAPIGPTSTPASESQPNDHRRRRDNGRDDNTHGGVSFFQRTARVDGPPVAGTNGITEEAIDCWRCGRRGHRSPLCPTASTTGIQGFQMSFAQQTVVDTDMLADFVCDSWILLDTGSTFNSACNQDILGSLEECTPMHSLHIYQGWTSAYAS